MCDKIVASGWQCTLYTAACVSASSIVVSAAMYVSNPSCTSFLNVSCCFVSEHF